MTSICIQSREMGSISACAVIEEGDIHTAFTVALPTAGLVLRLTLNSETLEELGEALVQMSKEQRPIV